MPSMPPGSASLLASLGARCFLMVLPFDVVCCPRSATARLRRLLYLITRCLPGSHHVLARGQLPPPVVLFSWLLARFAPICPLYPKARGGFECAVAYRLEFKLAAGFRVVVWDAFTLLGAAQ